MSVRENPHVDTDTLLGIFRFRGSFIGCLDTEDSVPLSSGFLLNRDGLNVRFVGQVAVESERNVTEFREPQSRLAARVLELEAGLTVGETSVFIRCLPLERPNTVAAVFATTER